MWTRVCENTRANGERKREQGALLQLYAPLFQRAGVNKAEARRHGDRRPGDTGAAERGTECWDREGEGRRGLCSSSGRGGPEKTRLPSAVLFTAPQNSHAGPPAARPLAAMASLQVPLRTLDRSQSHSSLWKLEEWGWPLGHHPTRMNTVLAVATQLLLMNPLPKVDTTEIEKNSSHIFPHMIYTGNWGGGVSLAMV